MTLELMLVAVSVSMVTMVMSVSTRVLAGATHLAMSTVPVIRHREPVLALTSLCRNQTAETASRDGWALTALSHKIW